MNITRVLGNGQGFESLFASGQHSRRTSVLLLVVLYHFFLLPPFEVTAVTRFLPRDSGETRHAPKRNTRTLRFCIVVLSKLHPRPTSDNRKAGFVL